MSKSVNSSKPKLKIEEIAKRERIMKSVMEKKRAGKIDVEATFDLIHLSVYPLLQNREIVEEDMKELKKMLDAAANRIGEMIEKSKGKPQNNSPT
jgi:cation transport regulator ChaC